MALTRRLRLGLGKWHLPAPKISPFSFSTNLTVGERGTAICTATVGDQPLTFRWLKNGRRLTDEKKSVTVTDNADFSVLKLPSLSLESSGNYTCIVSNLFGSASHSATLRVHGRSEELASSENGSLVITWARKEHEDLYTCKASNGIGQRLEKTVQVAVKFSPKITPFSFASKLVSGQRATVTCSTFEGDRPLTFAWLKDGSTLSKHNNVEWNEEKGYSTLNISPLSLQDSGNYTCVVSNSAGSDSLSSSLVVHGHPLREDNARVRQWHNGTLVIARTTKDDGGRYRCQAGNAFGDILEEEVVLTEPTGPLYQKGAQK
ncbi:ttnl protein, putative [Ixodes scapularis]|uniref:Ttnl protein, putative n=1 Tax=Ixodes scapularis TaxID=6945 RepID=B7P779_IXOSC|nr:ttnl protein, putative [Ixodes scapularis]|eukprot:XP_002409788.1 ttnl protein, putative [Ixodes scapularis]